LVVDAGYNRLVLVAADVALEFSFCGAFKFKRKRRRRRRRIFLQCRQL